MDDAYQVTIDDGYQVRYKILFDTNNQPYSDRIDNLGYIFQIAIF